MSDHDKWHWQEGRIWRGIGIYHVTMVVSNRQPLLGNLVIPDNDPSQTRVDRTELGESIVKDMFRISDFHPEVEIVQFCLMPDHIHVILHVKRTMPKGIGSVVRGFWQGAKKTADLQASSIFPNTIRSEFQGRIPVFTEKPFIRPLSHKGQFTSISIRARSCPQNDGGRGGTW